MNKQGNVYVVQLMPESLPNRVKVGFSMDMDKRLASFTTICPNAKLLASWKGDTEKERAAINLLAAKYNKVGREVFDVNDIELLKEEIAGIISNDFIADREFIEDLAVCKKLMTKVDKNKTELFS